ncbi:hypothetical protein XHV734_2943 [Xanthomonas hortorum pv. vitians]|nr:hypothetical protein XHV734_2943 [Xanthomonas hortorum pv. vitians]
MQAQATRVGAGRCAVPLPHVQVWPVPRLPAAGAMASRSEGGRPGRRDRGQRMSVYGERGAIVPDCVGQTAAGTTVPFIYAKESRPATRPARRPKRSAPRLPAGRGDCRPVKQRSVQRVEIGDQRV